jgi:3-oxoacyl-[acyl-carrier protein] reductase
MDLGISGKVAMVAAASKGIGLATARMLAAEGCHVSICGRTEETLEQAAAYVGEDTRTYVANVSDPDDLAWWVEQTRADLGPISILVTNTGGPPGGSFEQMTDDQWKEGVETTLMNVIRLVRLVTDEMKAQSWGRIVHITSLVAMEPSDMLPISSTLRAGLMAFTRLQSNALAPHGITVNGVLPGHTLTDRQTHLAEIESQKSGATVEEVLEKRGKQVPVGRLADPDEIAAAITFLCSQQASYITGTNVLVDGGFTKGTA